VLRLLQRAHFGQHRLPSSEPDFQHDVANTLQTETNQVHLFYALKLHLRHVHLHSGTGVQ
jgi:hypothetical protein